MRMNAPRTCLPQAGQGVVIYCQNQLVAFASLDHLHAHAPSFFPKDPVLACWSHLEAISLEVPFLGSQDALTTYHSRGRPEDQKLLALPSSYLPVTDLLHD